MTNEAKRNEAYSPPIGSVLYCHGCGAQGADIAFFPRESRDPEKRVGVQPRCPMCRGRDINTTPNDKAQFREERA